LRGGIVSSLAAEGRRSGMLETDKIVAAILSIGYAAQNGGGIKPQNYIELYEEFLGELSKPKASQETKAQTMAGDSLGSIVRQSSLEDI
jgi:hypothetical protein